MLPESDMVDSGDLGDLLLRYRGYLRLMASMQIDRRLQGKVDPSDLVQETIVEAQQKFAQFRGSTQRELMAWLRKVLATQLAQYVRRYSAQMRDLNLEEQLQQELDESTHKLSHEFAASTPSPSENAIQRETAVLVADAIAKLPSHYREVILLRNFNHLRFAQIAEQLGRSPDATKKLWVRAVQRLRTELG